MKTTVNRLLCSCLFPALLLAGCSRRNEATVGTPENPLVIALSPAHTPASPEALAVIKEQLEAGSGLSVELKEVGSAAEVVSAFNSDKTDAGLVTLEEYLVAREDYDVRAGLQVLRGKGLSDYEGVLLTRSGGAKSISDLAGAKVGFVGPYSVSGFTLPAIYLAKEGVKARVEFASGHDAVLKKLLHGDVLAIATYARQATRSPGLKVLAVTGRVPNEPVIFRRGLDEKKRAVVEAAFISLASGPEGRKALGALADITGFKPADPAVYRPLHELLRSKGKAVYDLVPQGWDMHRLSQPYRDER